MIPISPKRVRRRRRKIIKAFIKTKKNRFQFVGSLRAAQILLTRVYCAGRRSYTRSTKRT